MQPIHYINGLTVSYSFLISATYHGPLRILRTHGFGNYLKWPTHLGMDISSVCTLVRMVASVRRTPHFCAANESSGSLNGFVMARIHIQVGAMMLRRGSSTQPEAEYPRALCEQYANVLERMVYGSLDTPRFHGASEKLRPQQQAKGRTMPQIIPEFGTIRCILSSNAPHVDDKRLLKGQWMGVPSGSKLLRTEAKGGEQSLCVFGVFRSMAEFTSVARQLWHPLTN